MKIIALGGSLRPHSRAYSALKLALRRIEAHHVETELVDLRQLRLPFCNGESFYPGFPDVERLRESMLSASGILIATPEYHGDMSGVLKNTLDLLEEEHVAGKVAALIAVVGGVHSTNALNSLRLICRQLHCWVIPEQLVIPHAEESFDAMGELKDPQLEVRLDLLVEHLIKAARHFHAR